MAEYSTRDKLSCAVRELALRQAVYPKWVAAQRMQQAKADREIEMMTAIVEDYRKLADAEPVQPPAQEAML